MGQTKGGKFLFFPLWAWEKNFLSLNFWPSALARAPPLVAHGRNPSGVLTNNTFLMFLRAFFRTTLVILLCFLYNISHLLQVTELYKKLTSLGYSCWQDINQMGAGDSLFDKIDSGVRSCNVVVSCVTQKYSLSLNCRREVSLATSINKPIIPLLLEKMAWPPSGPMSMALTQLQYLDFTNQTKLVTGDSFNVLLVLLAKQSIFKPKTDSKKMAQMGTTMHAATKLKRGKSKPQQPARQSPAKSAQQEESNQGDTKSESRACSIL